MERVSGPSSSNEGEQTTTDSSLDHRIEEVASKLKLKRTDVKKVLKTVLTDDDVLEFFRSFLDKPELHDAVQTSSRVRYEPKLTRRKFRELLGAFKPGGISETASRASLLEAEFPDDEEDDEFKPECEDEYEQDAEAGPETTSASGAVANEANRVLATNDADDEALDALKIDDDQIALRTRSRCNLSNVPVDALALRSTAECELELEPEQTHVRNREQDEAPSESQTAATPTAAVCDSQSNVKPDSEPCWNTEADFETDSCRLTSEPSGERVLTEAAMLQALAERNRLGPINEEVEWHKFLLELGALNGGDEFNAPPHDDLDDALLNGVTQTQQSPAAQADVEEQDDPEFDPFAAFDERDIDELVEELRFDRATRVSKRELATLFDEHLENADADADADADVHEPADAEDVGEPLITSQSDCAERKLFPRISEQTRSRIRRKLEQRRDQSSVNVHVNVNVNTPDRLQCEHDAHALLTPDALKSLHVEMSSGQIDEVMRQLTMHVQQVAQTAVLSCLPHVAADTDHQFAHVLATASLNDLARRRRAAGENSVYARLPLDTALGLLRTNQKTTQSNDNDRDREDSDNDANWKHLTATFLRSETCLVPELLPAALPRLQPPESTVATRFTNAEDCLIALGLIEFRVPTPNKRKSFNDFAKWSVYELISKRYLPTKSARQIEWHVHNLRCLRRARSRVPCRTLLRHRFESNPIRQVIDGALAYVPHAAAKYFRVDDGAIIHCRDKISRVPFVYRKYVPLVLRMEGIDRAQTHDENAIRGFESELTLTNLPNSVLEVEAIDALIELSNVSVFLRDMDAQPTVQAKLDKPAVDQKPTIRVVETEADEEVEPDLETDKPSPDADDSRNVTRGAHTEDDLDTLYARLYVSQLASSLPLKRYGQVLTLLHTYHRLVLDAHERYLFEPTARNAEQIDAVVCELVARFEQLLLADAEVDDVEQNPNESRTSTGGTTRNRLHHVALFYEFGRFLTLAQASRCGLAEQYFLYREFAALLAELKPLVNGNAAVQTRFVNYAEKIEKRRLVPSSTLNAVRTALKRIAPKSDAECAPRPKNKRQRIDASLCGAPQSLADQFRDVVNDERMSPTKGSYADAFCQPIAFDEVHMEHDRSADAGSYETVRLTDCDDPQACSYACACACVCHRPPNALDHCAACGLALLNGQLVYRPNAKANAQPVELLVIAAAATRLDSPGCDDVRESDNVISEHTAVSPACYAEVDVIQANDVLIFDAHDVHVEEVRLDEHDAQVEVVHACSAQATADVHLTAGAVEWSRADDALILDTCQRVGTADVDSVTVELQRSLPGKTHDQIRRRVATLLTLYASI